MAELKPCPFCGGEAAYIKEEDKEFGQVSSVYCENCGARGEFFLVSDSYCSKDKAIEAWNRRESDGE